MLSLQLIKFILLDTKFVVQRYQGNIKLKHGMIRWLVIALHSSLIALRTLCLHMPGAVVRILFEYGSPDMVGASHRTQLIKHRKFECPSTLRRLFHTHGHSCRTKMASSISKNWTCQCDETTLAVVCCC